MHPRLFTIGPFTIYSFGLMMALGFITASFVMSREAQRKHLLLDFSRETVAFLRFAIGCFVLLFAGTYLAQFGSGKFLAELGSGSYGHAAIVAGAILLYAVMPKLFSSSSAADTSTLVVMISLIAGLGG